MKELVVISGKGGTGKTSIVASFAVLANGQAVVADCDVDAADLHILLDPKVIRTESFSGGKRATIDLAKCIGCGKCQDLCRFGAVRMELPQTLGEPLAALNDACRSCSYCVRSCSARASSEIQAMIRDSQDHGQVGFSIDPAACEGCGVCAWFCPAGAIDLTPAINGEWFVSDTRAGPMVHAKLGVAEENSGKLVTTVRKAASSLCEDRGLGLVLIDGSPGIGCPVIASITGADMVLIVTEPTLSGLHDLKRVAKVVRYFDIPGMVCINKWDLNLDMTAKIERQSKEMGLGIAGQVRYDQAITDAQVQRQAVVEYQATGCSEDIVEVWNNVRKRIGD